MRIAKFFTTLVFFATLILGCQKNGASNSNVPTAELSTTPSKEISTDKKSNQTRYAQYGIGVFKDRTLDQATEKGKAKMDPIAYLSEAEPVILISEETLTFKDQQDKDRAMAVSKIKLSDDTVGYILSEHLSLKTVVTTSLVTIYDRNNDQSRESTQAAAGLLGYVIAEREDGWYQINIKDAKVYRKWVKSSALSDDSNLITDAKKLRKARAILNGKLKDEPKSKEEALKILTELSTKSHFISQMASQELAKFTIAEPEDISNKSATETESTAN